jgi:hypothetical protein
MSMPQSVSGTKRCSERTSPLRSAYELLGTP